ncbi:MAG: hypothetical protein IJD59_01590 [Clostridia bacterium]|nr:hypothetical protein [Clostridia bacterium]
MSVLKLNVTNFDHAIANGVALVDFYADWCRSCKTFSHITKEIAAEREDITVGKYRSKKSRIIPSLPITNEIDFSQT